MTVTTSDMSAGRGAPAPDFCTARSLAGRVVRLAPDVAGALLGRSRAGFAFFAAPFVAASSVEPLAAFAGLLLGRFEALAFGALVVRFGGDLLGRFDVRFLVVFFAARVFVWVRFVAMAPLEHLIRNHAKGKRTGGPLVVDDVHELEAFGLRGRLGRCRNQPNFLITHGLEDADHERVSRGHLSKKILKRRPGGVTNRVRCQSAPKRAALLPEARGDLPGEPPTRRVGATRGEHLPPEHRTVPVVRNPKLKHLVL